jgi:hypothetical protein
MKSHPIMAAIVGVALGAAYSFGYIRGDRDARTDYATELNRCYDMHGLGDENRPESDRATAEDLYGCVASWQ